MSSFNNPSDTKLMFADIENALQKGQDEVGGILPCCKRSTVLRSSALIFLSSNSYSSNYANSPFVFFSLLRDAISLSLLDEDEYSSNSSFFYDRFLSNRSITSIEF